MARNSGHTKENSNIMKTLWLTSATILMASCQGLAEEHDVFSKGLEWAVGEAAKKVERDRYVVDYEALEDAEFEALPPDLFLKEVDEMCSRIIDANESINAPKVPVGDDPFAPVNQEERLNNPDLISLRIQQAAICCRMLHESAIGAGNVKVRLLSRIRLVDIVARAGDGNFLVEISIRRNGKTLKSYFYIWELLQFYKDGPWRESKVVFAVLAEKE